MNPVEVVAATRGRDAYQEARQALALALDELAGRDVLGVISLASPRADAGALLEGSAADALVWAPEAGPVFSGAGGALTLQASGPHRFRHIREQAAAQEIVRLGSPGAPAPRWFGGFAFQTGGLAAPWTDFGEARFTLPRWRYAEDNGRAWLDLAVHGTELPGARERENWMRELDRWWRLLAQAPAPRSWKSVALVSADQGARGGYEASVASIVDAIRSGRFEKVVAARRAVLELDPAPDPPALLSRLALEAPGCTRFLFRRGTQIFMGATPERLIEKRGVELSTEALAGSIRAGSPEQAALLRASEKDIGEHQLVVRQIVACLAPLCSALDHPAEPEIRSLKHVLHLRTPIRGALAVERHVLELVEALHPTPAVGGVPTAEAQRWIREHEAEPRGWYAGPVGCFDADGDGQFAVALRSGLFEGARAHLYAGAGIVRDSDPASEYAETRLKLLSLLSVLGVDV